MSFRLKTVLGVALIEIALLALLVFSTHWRHQQTAGTELAARARAEARLVALTVSDALAAFDIASIEAVVATAAGDPGLAFLRVRDADGRVIAAAGADAALDAPFAEDALWRDALRDGRFDAAAPVEAGGIRFGAVELGVWTAEAQQSVAGALAWSLGIAGLEILLVGLLGWGLGSLLTRQLADLRRGAERIGAGELGVQIPVRGDDDLARTARCFNAMSAQQAAAHQTLAAARHDIERALTAEQSLNAVQRRFVAMVSHEFRNPLAIIDGRARQIARAAGRRDAPDMAERAGDIRHAAGRLGELVDSVSLMARINDDAMEIAPEPTDLRALLETCAGEARLLAPGRAILCDAADAPAIRCDPRLIRRVVGHLLGNALRFSEAPAPVALAARPAAEGGARVTVSDQGVGIPEDERPMLFSLFLRASAEGGRPGTGVGLYVTRRIVEMHGGRIAAASAVGAGTTFTVTLPAEPLRDPPVGSLRPAA